MTPASQSPQNRLAAEVSPYLRSHATNPVDWHPWGDEAFARAAAEDKPVFLSIGYATCHWCHVMERESFTDPALAAELNAVFVPIKVDREERPDVDAVYLKAGVALTGSAGWPLTVLLTPDRQPFFAGTYFPPESRRGRIGLRELIERVREAWQDRRDDLVRSAREITAALAEPPPDTGEDRIDEAVLAAAERQLAAQHDARHGGFGDAPKFPTAHHLRFLMRRARRTGAPAPREQARHTLLAMRAGGLWDHVGSGFHRYSTDAAWRVPHFEKMLYDQALLVHAYLDGFEATGDATLAATARDTLAYVLRDLALPGGGLATAEDADSEGVEGRFYLWSLADLQAVIPPDLALWAAATFQVTERGTHPAELGPGQCHLALAGIAALEALASPEAQARLGAVQATLREVRAARVRPLRDDKVLLDLDGLALGALARAGRTLGDPTLVTAAREVLAFIEQHLITPAGELLHRHRAGQSGIPAFIDDHAFLVDGLLELHAATQDPEHLAAALRVQHAQEARLGEPGGGYALSGATAAELPFRPREHADGALPAGSSVTAHNLLHLARLTGDPAWTDRLDRLLAALAPEVRRAPTAFTHLLLAVDRLLHDDGVVVVAGEAGAPDTAALLAAARSPDRRVLLRTPETSARLGELAPWTAGLVPVGGRATAYCCREGRCDLPVTDPATLGRPSG